MVLILDYYALFSCININVSVQPGHTSADRGIYIRLNEYKLQC